jgi:hypothetical protein
VLLAGQQYTRFRFCWLFLHEQYGDGGAKRADTVAPRVGVGVDFGYSLSVRLGVRLLQRGGLGYVPCKPAACGVWLSIAAL